MFFGYNTNGFAHHRLEDAIAILAELGYQGIAITLDFGVLNPFSENLRSETAPIRDLLKRLGLRSVIETGARFLLDPRRKHQPTLLSSTASERSRRIEFLNRAIDLAAELGSDAVSFWSGTPIDAGDEESHWRRLADGCRSLIDAACRRGVTLAFEPEPGMFIDRMDRFAELCDRLNDPRGVFGLTLDVGHLHCLGETPIVDQIRRWAPRLRNVHIEDMRRGVHDHLVFGEGEMDFQPILTALGEVYDGGAYVELSRHSHDAVETARKSLAFLKNHEGQIIS